jgi:hypothetical protein
VAGLYSTNKDFGFFIQGHIKTLDRLGEWHYSPSSKKLSVFFGSGQPGSHDLRAGTIDNLVTNAQNTGHIGFENLHFRGANRNAFFLHHGQNITIRNVDIDFSGEDGAFIHNLPGLAIENSRISNSLNNGLSVLQNTAGSRITDNRIENTNLLLRQREQTRHHLPYIHKELGQCGKRHL